MRAQPDERGPIQNLVSFVLVSVIAGALVAGLFLPIVKAVSSSTTLVENTFAKLPATLDTEPLPARSQILTADGQLIANIYSQNRVVVPLNKIAPVMQQALVAIEDSRFFSHGALDLRGTMRALVTNQSAGGNAQGGSSITQQLVKMTLLQQAKTPEEEAAATADTYARKIRELRHAIAFEDRYSKPEILNRYLNIAYFGDGSYGVQAAARHYFNTNAANLNLAQAALLAGIVRNPGAYDPTNNIKRSKNRRDVVIRRMLDLKVITPAAANAAIRTPVRLNVQPIPNGCANTKIKNSQFFCEYVINKLVHGRILSKSVDRAEDALKSGGYTIHTSFDIQAQAAAQWAINQRSRPTDTAAAAMSVVQPGTGKIRAMVQSRPYGNNKVLGETVYNYNAERRTPDGRTNQTGLGGFQNGSTMKVFTLAAALTVGYPLTMRIESPDRIDLSNVPFATCTGTVKAPKYMPKNSTRGGDIDMTEATQNSTNTYYLLLSQRLGLCGTAKLARSMGMYNATTGKQLLQVPSFTLGVDEVTPLQVAGAYATFAARGKYCAPVSISKIVARSGRTVWTPKNNCKQVMKQHIADTVNQVLQSVMTEGTGRRVAMSGRPSAGKTGTTNNNHAVWFAGYTPQLAGAAVVSRADPPQRDLRQDTLNGRRIGRDVSGSSTAGPIWRQAMQAMSARMPVARFAEPDEKAAMGNSTEVPYVEGYRVSRALEKLRAAGFTKFYVDPTRRYSGQPRGSVAYTEPASGNEASRDQVLIIYQSTGYRPSDQQAEPARDSERRPARRQRRKRPRSYRPKPAVTKPKPPTSGIRPG